MGNKVIKGWVFKGPIIENGIAALAQQVERESHNLEVVSSILTSRTFYISWYNDKPLKK